MAPSAQRIPVVLLTGFLGSGKTTLLRRLLVDPAMSNSAVLINEAGEIGVDQHLIGAAALPSTTVLENGCLCCTVRDHFAAVLEDLFWSRLHRRIPRFDRLLIETTGLADPLPIIALLDSEPLLAERYRLAHVVCTVDASVGPERLRAHPESLSQAALADTLLLTKADIAEAAALDDWQQRLERINPAARLYRIAEGQIAPEALFGDPDAEADTRSLTPASALARRVGEAAVAGLRGWSRTANAGAMPFKPGGRLGRHSRTATFVYRVPLKVRRTEFERSVANLLATHRGGILRAKGIVRFDDDPHPWVVQVAGGRQFRGEPVPEGSAIGDSFLIFIVDGIEASAVTAFLDREMASA